MMHVPFIWLALSAIVLLAAISYFRSRANRLQLRIEPVGQERLDPTPEPTEIMSNVRVRTRSASSVVKDNDAKTIGIAAKSAALRGQTAKANALKQRIEPTMTAPVAATDTAEVAIEVTASPVEVVHLAQEDLFPEAIHDALAIKSANPSPMTSKAVAAANAEKSSPAHLADTPAEAERPLFDVAELPIEANSETCTLTESDIIANNEGLICLRVIAREQAFAGRELLELLLQYGLRFGDMSIFHRHEYPTGLGEILFSVAHSQEPGTFDLDALTCSQVPGVSLFMSLPGYKSLTTYDLMVDTARRLAKDLDGDLLNQFSTPVSAEQLEAWRDEVVEFERRRLQTP